MKIDLEKMQNDLNDVLFNYSTDLDSNKMTEYLNFILENVTKAGGIKINDRISASVYIIQASSSISITMTIDYDFYRVCRNERFQYCVPGLYELIIEVGDYIFRRSMSISLPYSPQYIYICFVKTDNKIYMDYFTRIMDSLTNFHYAVINYIFKVLMENKERLKEVK